MFFAILAKIFGYRARATCSYVFSGREVAKISPTIDVHHNSTPVEHTQFGRCESSVDYAREIVRKWSVFRQVQVTGQLFQREIMRSQCSMRAEAEASDKIFVALREACVKLYIM